MARDLTWAGGEHSFELKIEHLRALQTKCDAGPAWILSRLSSGAWMVDDVVETIRLGLEGGGLAKEDARRLVKQHVEDKPLTFSVLTAQAILMLALYGEQDDQPGEADAGEVTAQHETVPAPKKKTSPAANGDSADSTNGQES